jgi:hypothetical protein
MCGIENGKTDGKYEEGRVAVCDAALSVSFAISALSFPPTLEPERNLCLCIYCFNLCIIQFYIYA